MNDLPRTFTEGFASRGWTVHPHPLTMLEHADDIALLLITSAKGSKKLSLFIPKMVCFTI
jgi:ATP-dependent Lhr-like helicase